MSVTPASKSHITLYYYANSGCHGVCAKKSRKGRIFEPEVSDWSVVLSSTVNTLIDNFIRYTLVILCRAPCSTLRTAFSLSPFLFFEALIQQGARNIPQGFWSILTWQHSFCSFSVAWMLWKTWPHSTPTPHPRGALLGYDLGTVQTIGVK